MFLQFISLLGSFMYSEKTLLMLIFLEVLTFYLIVLSFSSSGLLLMSLVSATMSTVLILILFISSLKIFSIDYPQASLN